GQRRDNGRGERPDNGNDRYEKRPRQEGEIVHVLIRLAELPNCFTALPRRSSVRLGERKAGALETDSPRRSSTPRASDAASEGGKQFRRPRVLIRCPMEASNERELVERCRRGDEGAVQELVDGYKDLVFALIARTVQDRSRAEDLAQDVFLRVHRGLPYFRGEARLSTWIYR